MNLILIGLKSYKQNALDVEFQYRKKFGWKTLKVLKLKHIAMHLEVLHQANYL